MPGSPERLGDVRHVREPGGLVRDRAATVGFLDLITVDEARLAQAIHDALALLSCGAVLTVHVGAAAEPGLLRVADRAGLAVVAAIPDRNGGATFALVVRSGPR